MELNTHKVIRKKDRIALFKKANNPNEVFTFFLRLLKILGYMIFIPFASISLFRAGEFSWQLLFFIPLTLFVAWLLFYELQDLIIYLKRYARPILLLQKEYLELFDEKGLRQQIPLPNIRSLKGKIYRELLDSNRRVHFRNKIYFGELVVQLKDGRNVPIDLFNTTKTGRTLKEEVLQDVKRAMKKVGILLGKELEVQYFLEKGISDWERKARD